MSDRHPTSVGVILVDPLLTGCWLSRRVADAATFPNVWQTPGGAVESKESLEDAIAREVHEETLLRGLQYHFVDHGFFDKPDGTIYEAIHYLAITERKPLRREPRKNSDWHLFRWKEITSRKILYGHESLCEGAEISLMPSTFSALRKLAVIGDR